MSTQPLLGPAQQWIENTPPNARHDENCAKVVRTILNKHGSKLPRVITPSWVVANAFHLMGTACYDMGPSRTGLLLNWAAGYGADTKHGRLEVEAWLQHNDPCRECGGMTSHRVQFCRHCLLPIPHHPAARALIIHETRKRFEMALVKLDGELQHVEHVA